LQQRLGFADEELAMLQGTLAALGVNNALLEDATLATLAWAEAVGKDMKSAATDVAKALNGNTMMLRRYGLMVNNGEEAMAALLGKFTLVEAQANSFATQSKRLAANLGDLGETLGMIVTKGGAASGVLADMSAALVWVRQDVQRTTDGTDDLFNSIVKLATFTTVTLNPAILGFRILLNESAKAGRELIEMNERIAQAEKDVGTTRKVGGAFRAFREEEFKLFKPGELLPSERPKKFEDMTEKEKKAFLKKKKEKERLAKAEAKRLQRIADEENKQLLRMQREHEEAILEEMIKAGDRQREEARRRVEFRRELIDTELEIEAAFVDAKIMLAEEGERRGEEIFKREHAKILRRKEQERREMEEMGENFLALGDMTGVLIGRIASGQADIAEVGKAALSDTMGLVKSVAQQYLVSVRFLRKRNRLRSAYRLRVRTRRRADHSEGSKHRGADDHPTQQLFDHPVTCASRAFATRFIERRATSVAKNGA
jgi:hypothetical protein